MKKLSNQALIYDKDCPLCNAYSATFIKAGMLDQDGRVAYTAIDFENCDFVDSNRARNEIALVDYETKTVTYGIDSLLKVIGHSFPFVLKIGKKKLVYSFLKRLYAFVSYNRKVVMPAPKTEITPECKPDFNLKYRLLYIAFSGIITAFVLYNYQNLISLYVHGKTFLAETMIAFFQIPFQWIFIQNLNRKTQVNYFGNLMTVSLFGSILLRFPFIFKQFTHLPQQFSLIWFLITSAIIFAEHNRRIKILQLPKILCSTWLLYRILLLVTILLFN